MNESDNRVPRNRHPKCAGDRYFKCVSSSAFTDIPVAPTSSGDMCGYRVGVVGATGLVGGLIIKLLIERGFPAREIVPFASQRSAGKVVAGQTVRPLTKDTIAGFDLALFSAGGEISREWAPRFVEAGSVVIDNSSYWRMQPNVPLVVSEVNPEELNQHRGIIANPNCSTMQMVVALKPIYDAVGIDRIIVSTYQATSGTGSAAINELDQQIEAILQSKDEQTRPAAITAGTLPSLTTNCYPHPIAFNVIPQAGNFPSAGDDHTDEEYKLMRETRKILGDENIRINATCVRVPVITGHSEAVTIETKNPLTPDQARDLLNQSPGIKVIDDPAASKYPHPLQAAGQDEVFVGRIRKDPSHEHGLSLWIVADNLRKGAATNAISLAEILHQQGLICSVHTGS
jgi:aspartate-semialdehyde dehydrogenase